MKTVMQGKRFDPTPVGTLQGTNVVMNLMKDSRLLRKGFNVCADSFFSSLNLANKLLWERIYLTGTLRKNRPMPQMIKNARPQAGMLFTHAKDRICFVVSATTTDRNQ